VHGIEERAEQVLQIFKKKGSPGYLSKDPEIYEAERDVYDAATDHALLGEKDAAFADLEKPLTKASKWTT
jgi:hypothetical protein